MAIPRNAGLKEVREKSSITRDAGMLYCFLNKLNTRISIN